MKRLWRWLGRVYGYLVGDALIDEYLKPFRSEPPRAPMSWDDSSEPDEPKREFLGRKTGEQPTWLTSTPIYGQRKPKAKPFDELTETLQDLADLERKVVEYPPKRDQPTRDWVTDRLKELTGGLTRHPYDLTHYPTPPTEADLAARDFVNTYASGPKALFSHGYSMSYLHTLLRRAEQQDRTLTAEELMALRARGLA